MIKRLHYPVLLTLLLAPSSVQAASQPQGAGTSRPPRTDRKGIAFFEKKIRPVLVQHCYKCHSTTAKKSKGGLLLDTRAGLLKGGESGPAIVPGDVKEGTLISALEYKDLRMPPGKKLSDAVIADFRTWVQMGAPDPRVGKTALATRPKYGKSARELWSLQPLRQPRIPAVKDRDWPRSPLDHFVLAKLEQKELAPVADADPLSLLRRTYFDLVGLPPSPEVVDQFTRDHSPRAYTQLVDTLLASPQFGERWGRHWLDVARYAESNGKDRDALFPHAWRYRNYVIDSFNKDKPYDRFLTEQIAGDLLPARSPEQKQEHLVATGFLALGPKNFMQRGERFAMDLADDQIDTTTRAILGLTVSCARCHDHKFDPIPTRDYYSLASIFRSTKTFYGSRNKNASNLLVLGNKTKAPQAPSDQTVAQLRRELRKLIAQRNRLRKSKAPDKAKKQRAIQQQIRQLQAKIRKGATKGPIKGDFAMGVQEDKPVDLRVLVRGVINKKGQPAPRGFLSCITLDKPIKVNPKQSGRLELARWLTDPSNPLTARVAVNRTWHHLFGRGIVRTTDNFGSNGEAPTHPELLDHLAREFISNGWSNKKLIRTIVLSRTYQLGSIYNANNYEVDPDNTLVWRHTRRRLDAESLRDATLAVSGQLNLKRPEKSVVARMGYGEVGRGINMRPLQEAFPHRSVYLPILRSLVPEVLRLFDFPEPSLVVGQRSTTTVPAQALYLMNSPFIISNARSLADQLRKTDEQSGIVRAYKLCFGRPPTQREKENARTYLVRCDQKLQKMKPDSTERERLVWTSYCQALLASAEFRYVP